MNNPKNPSIGLDAAMKAMEHVKPCHTFDLVTPVPDGYEMDADGTTLLVDRSGVKPTLYFRFSTRTGGWRPSPPNCARSSARGPGTPRRKINHGQPAQNARLAANRTKSGNHAAPPCYRFSAEPLESRRQQNPRPHRRPGIGNSGGQGRGLP